MPFSPREFSYAWRHIFMRFKRLALQQKPDHFVRLWQERRIPMEPLLYDGKPCYCQLCGFAMAELRLPEGWLAQSCSAVGFESLLDNKKLTAWTNELQKEKTKAP